MTSVQDSPPAAPAAVWALSPSRAMDFKTCALLYRFRVIDRLPEPPSLDAARGTVVHAVLERLFDLAADDRTVDAAAAMLEPQWSVLLAEDTELAALVAAEPGGLTDLIAGSRELLATYFGLEDPQRLEPAEREVLVETRLPSGLALKGFIDRLDRSTAGDLRVVDYKTGKSPGELYEGKALFQLRFYALVLWRATGVLPRLLRMLYLRDGCVLDYPPDEADLIALERQLEALAAAIGRARASGEWRAKPGPLCNWCAYQALCPAFGGTPPPLPELPVTG